MKQTIVILNSHYTQMNSSTEDWRIERKAMLTDLSSAEVLSFIRLHSDLFRRAYPARWINNLYFDTATFDAYTTTIEGNPWRKKVRVRWYGEQFGKAEHWLEVKRRRGIPIHKVKQTIGEIEMDRENLVQAIQDTIRLTELRPEMAAALDGQQPVLVNRYRRQYFQSSRCELRLTLDTDLSFMRVRLGRLSPAPTLLSKPAVILEIKYPKSEANQATNILDQLAIRITKSSKYATGIEHLFAK